MDPISEALMRSCIHDMANTLSGIQGILELSDPSEPFSTRNWARLEAILLEGNSTLERARHLAMETLPQASPETGAQWRRHLESLLRPLSVIFRCTLEITFEGSDAHDRWPGDLARGFVLSWTRQILPYVHGGTLKLTCRADAQGLQIRWLPVSNLPGGWQKTPDLRAMDIAARWAQRTGEALGARLSSEGEALLASIPWP